MLRDYRKKPDSTEYYILCANNGRNYYFLSLEKAEKVLEIQRNSETLTEWTLSHVKDGKSEVMNTIRKRETKTSKNKEFNLDEMLEEIATEKTTPIRRIN